MRLSPMELAPKSASNSKLFLHSNYLIICGRILPKCFLVIYLNLECTIKEYFTWGSDKRRRLNLKYILSKDIPEFQAYQQT